jgi:tetratricopeptide (TPR) repeat protein
MNYPEYLQSRKQAVSLLESGQLTEAAQVFHDLFLSDVSDIDKIQICAELAGISDRMGNTDGAVAWYDTGIVLEKNYCSYMLSEKKALYLSQIGRHTQAVQIYESLITKPYTSEDERERMRKTIQTLLSRTLGQWK